MTENNLFSKSLNSVKFGIDYLIITLRLRCTALANSNEI